MKKNIAIALICLSSSTFASSIKIPDFKVKLETVNPNIDLNKVTLQVEEYCEKISMLSGDASGARVFKFTYEINNNSNNEYEIPGKLLKCSAINGVRLYYSIYTSTGQFIHREQVEGYGNVVVSSEVINKRFEQSVVIK